MADMRCKPRLLVGTGCTKLKAKSNVYWNILPASIIQNNKPWIMVVSSSDEKQEKFEWVSVNAEESGERQIIGAATIYFSGFELRQNYNRDVLCFVRKEDEPKDTFYEYQLSSFPSITIRHYLFKGECEHVDLVPKKKMISHEVADEKSDCELSPCSRGGQNADSTTILPTTPGTENENNDNDTTEPNNEDDIHANEVSLAQGKAEGDVEDVNDNVNRQLLIYAVEMAFPHFSGPADSMMTGPTNTWKILEKLFELAKQACHKIVSASFFGRALKYFKIAHFGENFDYKEFFTESETKQILSMLDTCQAKADAFRDMNVDIDDCTGRASRVTVENKTREVISRSADDRGYQAVFHHHVMEATWDVIDLWNALCIGEFKSSYLLYHHLETGLEMLFNDKLRKLWLKTHFPNVTEAYFQKLLGPDEGVQMLNLDECVLAAYKGNMRINRMGRPNKGKNTVVSEMIRNRLDDEKLKNTGVVSKFKQDKTSNFKVACRKQAKMQCERKPTKKRKTANLLAFKRLLERKEYKESETKEGKE